MDLRSVLVKMNRPIAALLVCGVLFISLVERAQAQTAPPVPATLNQLMRGTLYPESNVVFSAQDTNPADVKHAPDPSMATDPLASQFGKWEAVENNALAMAEVATLLLVPGRKCSNGLDVPIKNADWAKLVQGLQDAAMISYAAAQTKSQDKMADAAVLLTAACANCHRKYRERKPGDRCK